MNTRPYLRSLKRFLQCWKRFTKLKTPKVISAHLHFLCNEEIPYNYENDNNRDSKQDISRGDNGLVSRSCMTLVAWSTRRLSYLWRQVSRPTPRSGCIAPDLPCQVIPIFTRCSQLRLLLFPGKKIPCWSWIFAANDRCTETVFLRYSRPDICVQNAIVPTLAKYCFYPQSRVCLYCQSPPSHPAQAADDAWRLRRCEP